MTAGYDWDGDGVEDVALGGGAKVDLDSSVGDDRFPNSITLFLSGPATTPFPFGACDTGETSEDIAAFPIQRPAVRIHGTQFTEGTGLLPPGTPAATSDFYMLADRFGWTVQFVGDVDSLAGIAGVADLAVGSPWFDAPDGGAKRHDAGAVYLYLGGTPIPPTSSTGLSGCTDLISHPADRTVDAGGLCSLIIEGDAPGSHFGYSIAGETDFDGDGIADLVNGAPAFHYQSDYDPAIESAPSAAEQLDIAWPHPDNAAGSVYVVFGAFLQQHLHPVGGASVPRILKISDLVSDPTKAIRIQASASQSRDRFGFSVDGFGNQDSDTSWSGDEIVVGAPQFLSDWQVNDSDVPGSKTSNFEDDADEGPGFLETWSWDSSSGLASHRFTIVGPNDASGGLTPAQARFGWSVSRIATRTQSPVGFIAGAPGFDTSDPTGSSPDKVDAGAVFAWELSSPLAPGPAPVPNLAWRLTGGDEGIQFGWAVASKGDLNGDGVPDVAIGARLADRRGAIDNPCTCAAGRFFDAGQIFVASSGSNCTNAHERLIATISGERARDRLGFGLAFGGNLVGGVGDELVGGALAWPDIASAALPFLSNCCTDTQTSGQSELGRAYRLDFDLLNN